MKIFCNHLNRHLDIHPQGVVCHNSDCPDVDSDLATNKRDLVKQHLVDRYGKECTASIGTIGTMGVKSTLRDLARLYEVPAEDINEITAHEMKSYEENDDDTIEDIRAKFPGLNALLNEYPKMATAFEKLRGSITNWGTHAGGVLITDINLFDNLPVRLDKEGKIVTTWQEGISGRELGQMGFIKFDMLAIDQLNVIEHILDLIEKNRGKKINPYDIPLDDHKALDLMNKKDGLCIFQFDTELAGKVVKNMNGIKRFEDLPALSTLMRPAALQNGFDKLFGKLRESGETVYLPDCLKEFLEDTYGLPIYQEHIMQAAIAMAGFDKVTAYKFMKLVYKGKLHTQEEKNEWRKKFVEGCRPLVEEGKVKPDFPDKFFTQILAFLGYGFCKCLSLDTRIETSFGEKELKDIKIGDFVKSLDDNGEDILVEVKDIFESESEIYEIETDDGHKLKSSLEHKYLCSDERMHELKDILENDLEIIVK